MPVSYKIEIIVKLVISSNSNGNGNSNNNSDTDNNNDNNDGNNKAVKLGCIGARSLYSKPHTLP